MTQVYFRVDDPSGAPRPNVIVFATLLGPNLSQVSTQQRQVSTRTDAFGNWILQLRPNSAFATGSYYEIAVGPQDRYRVVVPDSVYPVPLNAIVTGSVDSDAVALTTAEQELSVGQQLQVRHNIGLGTSSTHPAEDFAARADSICVVVQGPSGYGQVPTGYARYEYYGSLDPSLDSSLPMTVTSEWIIPA